MAEQTPFQAERREPCDPSAREQLRARQPGRFGHLFVHLAVLSHRRVTSPELIEQCAPDRVLLEVSNAPERRTQPDGLSMPERPADGHRSSSLAGSCNVTAS
jgi:hypothetical protein